MNADDCRMECLGVMEDKLNGSAKTPLSWELGAYESATGKPAVFTAEQADLIVEIVTPAA